MGDRVSIIIPVFNREHHVRYCVESILNLHYKDWELIIVDDGSTDHTFKVCSTLAREDKRIHVVSQVNGGVSVARNKGLGLATGDRVLFVDSDDILSPDFLDDLLEVNASQYDLFFFGRGNVRLTGGTVVFPHSPAREVVSVRGNQNILRFLYGKNNPYTNVVFYCTDKLFLLSIIRENHIRFDENVDLGEDQIFVMGYLMATENMYYNPNRKYCFISGGKSVENHLSGRLRSPEKHYSNIIANYNALYRCYQHSKVEELYRYAKDYLLDRFITKIFYSYCVPQNRRLLDEIEFESFCRDKIIPIYKENYKDYALIRNKQVRKLASTLVYLGGVKTLDQAYKYYVVNSCKNKVKRMIKGIVHRFLR